MSDGTRRQTTVRGLPRNIIVAVFGKRGAVFVGHIIRDRVPRAFDRNQLFVYRESLVQSDRGRRRSYGRWGFVILKFTAPTGDAPPSEEEEPTK